MKKSGFAKGVIWTLSIGIVLVVILATIGVVAYKGYTNAALEASYSRGNTETTIKIEKKDKNTKASIEEGDQTKIIASYKNIDFPDKKYTGQVNKDGQPHGQGSFVSTKEGINKGDRYEGNFVNGLKHGKGIYTWSNGEKFDGQFENNLRVEGTYYYKEGAIFKGTYQNDEIFYGELKYPSGKIYKGHFKNALFSGEGKFSWDNGDIFEGKFENNLRIEGTYTHLNGDKFIGKYKNGEIYYGTYYLKSLGSTHTGYYKNGKRHGQGIYTWRNGDIYDGQWENEDQNGQGTFTSKNGTIYTGQFKDGKRDGLGKLILANGKIFEGKFLDGEFIDDQKVVQKLKSKKTIKTDEKYYALVIGNNNYEHLEKLDAAENDAVVIADVLTNKYGFEVDLLLNADYDTTVNSLFKITNKLKKDDNLLIYYAGHGELDKAENRGYWLPVDASYELRSKWISNQRIVDRIKATKAKHVLLIADSCFSGTLMRSSVTPESNEALDEKNIDRLKSKKTRLVITSGGNEPVVDSDGGDHSLFALKLIDTLKNNNTVINSQMLFENIRRYVISNADQTPERALVHKTGHDGGDFLFFPKK